MKIHSHIQLPNKNFVSNNIPTYILAIFFRENVINDAIYFSA